MNAFSFLLLTTLFPLINQTYLHSYQATRAFKVDSNHFIRTNARIWNRKGPYHIIQSQMCVLNGEELFLPAAFTEPYKFIIINEV